MFTKDQLDDVRYCLSIIERLGYQPEHLLVIKMLEESEDVAQKVNEEIEDEADRMTAEDRLSLIMTDPTTFLDTVGAYINDVYRSMFYEELR